MDNPAKEIHISITIGDLGNPESATLTVDWDGKLNAVPIGCCHRHHPPPSRHTEIEPMTIFAGTDPGEVRRLDIPHLKFGETREGKWHDPQGMPQHGTYIIKFDPEGHFESKPVQSPCPPPP